MEIAQRLASNLRQIAAMANPIAQRVYRAMSIAFTEDLLSVRKGRKTTRKFENIISSTKMTVPIREVFEADLLEGYIARAAFNRPLTEREASMIEESGEARAQGILPNGEPAQVELFIQSPVRIFTEDYDGAQMVREFCRFARMIRAASQFDNATLYFRSVDNGVARCLLGDAEPRVSSFGGRMYASDVQNHEGTLVAVISPNEKGGTLANIEWVGRDFDATFREMEKEAAKVPAGGAKGPRPVMTQALPESPFTEYRAALLIAQLEQALPVA